MTEEKEEIITEITIESLSDINIEQLALNSDFGKLKFEKSHSSFIGLQNIFKNLDDHDYKNNLTQQEINNIDTRKKQFVDYLKRLQDFDIGQADSQQLHDNLESEVINFYDDTVRQFRLMQLALKDIVVSKSGDKKELEKQQKIAVEAEKEYKKLSEKLKSDLEELTEEKKKIATTSGEVAATRFGKYFENQAKENSEKAKKWLDLRSLFFNCLLLIIIGNFILYLFLFFTNKLNWWPCLAPEEIFTLQYGLVKLALLSLLSYGLAFASRNYNINSNIVEANKHRKNIADTLNSFLETKPEPDERSKIISQGTNAMFRHLPIGYISKSEQKDNGPIYEVINKILPSK